MKKILLGAAAFLIIGVACKDKQKPVEAEPEPQEIEQPAPAEPDTIAEQIEEPEPEPVEPDKYFVIAESFVNKANAESYQKKLSEQGYDSQIINRNWGENSEFYRVSYMGFKERSAAIQRMKQMRNEPGNEDVWVLVKK